MYSASSHRLWVVQRIATALEILFSRHSYYRTSELCIKQYNRLLHSIALFKHNSRLSVFLDFTSCTLNIDHIVARLLWLPPAWMKFYDTSRCADVSWGNMAAILKAIPCTKCCMRCTSHAKLHHLDATLCVGQSLNTPQGPLPFYHAFPSTSPAL